MEQITITFFGQKAISGTDDSRILQEFLKNTRRIPMPSGFFKHKNSDYNWVRIFQEFFEQTTAEKYIPLQFKDY